MSEQIKELVSLDDDGWMYLVRGTDRDTVYQMAVDEAASDNKYVTTPLEEVVVNWVKTVPCVGDACDVGPCGFHYVPVRVGTRGAFQAAFIGVEDLPGQAVELRQAGWRWGVGSTKRPSWGITPHPDQDSAAQIVRFREVNDPGTGPHRMYHRAGVDAPWREVSTVGQTDLL